MMMVKMRLNQRGNGGRYDEFGDCIEAARAFIFLVILPIFLGITLGFSYCIIYSKALKVSTTSTE